MALFLSVSGISPANLIKFRKLFPYFMWIIFVKVIVIFINIRFTIYFESIIPLGKM